MYFRVYLRYIDLLDYKNFLQSLLKTKTIPMSKEENNIAAVLEKILFTYHEKMQAKLSKISDTADNNFKNLNERITSIEEKLNALSTNTSTELNKVDGHLMSIKEELVKINDATGYEEIVSNIRIVSRGSN